MKLLLSLLLFLFPILGFSSGYNVLELAGKSESEISELLGPPEKCNETYQGESCEYTNHDIEIIYIENRADWITYTISKELPFDASALEYIGLKRAQPVVHNPTKMHWQHYYGLEVITIFGIGSKTLFIQVRAYTPQ